MTADQAKPVATDDRIVIFDTTLRDGEQSPGASMTVPEKVRIALLLEEMGVDIIEAGFAIASPGDFQAVNEVAKKIKNSVVCSLARASRADIERAARGARAGGAEAHPHLHRHQPPAYARSSCRRPPNRSTRR